MDELDDPAFELRPGDQDVSPAGLAAQSDVGAQAIHEPAVTTTGMAAAKPDHVTEQEREGTAINH